MKVLHVLDHSLPYFSGYSFRSDYIIRAQKRLGLTPVVITSPKHEEFESERERIEDVDYYRLRWPELTSSQQLSHGLQSVPMVKQMACIAAVSKEIARLAGEMKIDIIHAHSPSLNGLAAVRAAKPRGTPWIYELRYYDEDAAVDRGKIRHNSLRYRMSRRLEQSALEQAPRIVTISSGLRADLVKRGIDESKIFEIPNGVDTGYFQPLLPDEMLIAEYGLAGCAVIGFIGSLYFYEGLEYLVDAGVGMLRDGHKVKFLFVGEGEAKQSLESRVPAEFRGDFIFAGNVRHSEVRPYYSVMDVVVYPRISSRLTELTTPLKPLEAMAMERVVVGSDIGGIRELIREGETGFVVEAQNPAKLGVQLTRIVGDRDLRTKIGKQARDFVVRERDWGKIVDRYKDIYEAVVKG